MTDREFLEHRRRLARSWPLTSIVLVAMLGGLVWWLLAHSPNLIHPFHVVDAISSGAIEYTSLQLAAVLLPVVVIALLLVVLVAITFVYAMFAVERRYQRIIDLAGGPPDDEPAPASDTPGRR